MPATVLPYSPDDTAVAAHWLDYVAGAYAASVPAHDADAAAREAVDKLERRGLITAGAAALILEIFDLSPFDLA